jgi:hypothetical protein
MTYLENKNEWLENECLKNMKLLEKSIMIMMIERRDDKKYIC